MKNKHKCFVCGKRANPKTCWYMCDSSSTIRVICKKCYEKADNRHSVEGLGYEKEWNGKINE